MTPPTATSPDVDAGLELVQIPLDSLKAHPHNVRRRLGDLSELTKSIAGSGILEPLLVLPADDAGVHLVVAGHRRLAAARKATGVEKAPAIVRDLSPVEVLEAMLTENLQRAEITPIEEARAYARLVDLEATVAEIARKVGRSEKTVKARLALMALPAKVLDLIEDGTYSLGAADDLLSYADDADAMDWLLKEIKTERYTPTAYALRGYIAQRDRAREVEAKVAKLTDKGITRYEPKNGGRWDQPYELTLSKPCPLSKMPGVTVANHRNEPCHAVFIGISGWGSKIEEVPLCTQPKRHTTKAKAKDRSEVQLDPKAYEKSADAEAARRRAENKIRTSAEVRHRDGAAKALTYVPAQNLTDEIVAMAVMALDRLLSSYEFVGARKIAAQLTGIDPLRDDAGEPDWDLTWEELLATPERHLRALAAASTAACLHSRYTPKAWNTDTYTALLRFITANGYEPSDDEAPLIARALKEHEDAQADDLACIAGLRTAQAAEDAAAAERRANPSPELQQIFDRDARIAELSTLAADLDGEELDAVNAEISTLLAGGTVDTPIAYALRYEESCEPYGTDTFATLDEALAAQGAAMESGAGLIQVYRLTSEEGAQA